MKRGAIDEATLRGVDAIVNLAGAGVMDERWTPARLKMLHDSRTTTTRALVDTAKDARVFVSASAVGYYGMRRDDDELDESAPPGDDVLARICVDWESEARKSKARVAMARIGIVLGPDGGALARLLPIFRRFAGGPLGSGKQWWPWIHVEDVVGSILFAIDHDDFSGPFNATAPTPVTMNELAKTLGEVLHRPSFMRAPEFALTSRARRFGRSAPHRPARVSRRSSSRRASSSVTPISQGDSERDLTDRLQLDLRAELDDAVRRDLEERVRGARVARHEREEDLAPARHAAACP